MLIINFLYVNLTGIRCFLKILNQYYNKIMWYQAGLRELIMFKSRLNNSDSCRRVSLSWPRIIWSHKVWTFRGRPWERVWRSFSQRGSQGISLMSLWLKTRLERSLAITFQRTFMKTSNLWAPWIQARPPKTSSETRCHNFSQRKTCLRSSSWKKNRAFSSNLKT